MNTLVIYPGRFHGFHKGHKSVYDLLAKKFGQSNVYIATSNKVDPPKSPFTFNEKKQIITFAGVPADRVVQTTNPYVAKEITSNYDADNTVLFFAVSEKDMAEDPRFQFKPKKDGSPSYFQPYKKGAKLEPLSKHGYIITVPTLDFTVNGKPVRSASELRAEFAASDSETQKRIITDMYGQYSPEIHQLMKAKIIESRINQLKESINYVRSNAYRGVAVPVKLPKTSRPLAESVQTAAFEYNADNPKDSTIDIQGAGRYSIGLLEKEVARIVNHMSNQLSMGKLASDSDSSRAFKNIHAQLTSGWLQLMVGALVEAYKHLAEHTGVNESTNGNRPVTRQELVQLEQMLDKMYASLGIDVEFTRHFLDRVNDPRNQKQITISELAKLFKEQYHKHGKRIAQLGPDAQAVLKDLSTNVNLPFVLDWNRQSQELELIAKTVMRKKNFRTSNQEFTV